MKIGGIGKQSQVQSMQSTQKDQKQHHHKKSGNVSQSNLGQNIQPPANAAKKLDFMA